MSERKTSQDRGKVLWIGEDTAEWSVDLGPWVTAVAYLPRAVTQQEAEGLTGGTMIIENGQVVRPDIVKIKRK